MVTASVGPRTENSPDAERSDAIPSRRDLLSAAYDAFNARDIEAILAIMHPDVSWPNALEGGRLRGHAEVRAYWRRQ